MILVNTIIIIKFIFVLNKIVYLLLEGSLLQCNGKKLIQFLQYAKNSSSYLLVSRFCVVHKYTAINMLLANYLPLNS
jgi:hypothetical protein